MPGLSDRIVLRYRNLPSGTFGNPAGIATRALVARSRGGPVDFAPPAFADFAPCRAPSLSGGAIVPINCDSVTHLSGRNARLDVE
jgi:hypothetical protein